MMKRSLTLCVICLVASAAFAHEGVKNPAVKARMDSMSAIADNMKTLGTMAKGQIDFDAAIARAAATKIAGHAAETPTLFEPQETDPKSEALPAIWANFDDFSVKARELETIAQNVSVTLSTPDDLKAALGQMGATCKSCHSAYRE